MKVLLINGSPNANGNTAAALKEVAAALNAEGGEHGAVPALSHHGVGHNLRCDDDALASTAM